MRKKVLFMIGTFQSGGVSKSMVNLLNVFDKDRFDVHLMLLSKHGDVFSKYLPNGVTLHHSQIIEDLHGELPGAFRLLRSGHLLMALGSLLRMMLSRIDRSRAGMLLARLMPRIVDEEFDLIVDYGGQQQLYYMVDKLKGKKKVSFFHSDYRKWSYYHKADKRYYRFVDQIFTISDTCVEALKECFPEFANKISMMENISSPQLILKQAEEPMDMVLPKNKVVLATLGHLYRLKGWDYIIEAAKVLRARGVDFVWLQIGKIIEHDLVDVITNEGLENYFIFTGIKPNPYPYLKACDVYVHPSRFEGKSIALDEAKILCKPIVVTNFSTVSDQFEDRVNASICEMSGDDVAKKIMELLSNEQLRNSYVENLSKDMHDNSDEVKKLYKYLA